MNTPAAITPSLHLKPYGRDHKPFTIGLSQIATSAWLQTDESLSLYLNDKQRLLEKNRDVVFRACPESLAAQQEALAMVSRHLTADHAKTHTPNGSTMCMADRTVDLEDDTMPPLMRAGLMVADDLAILTKKDGHWHLSAGFVAFPSSWSLAEKAGRPMDEVHGEVPGFQAGSRNAAMITRIFDNLKPDLPAERFNWSFKGSNAMAMPPALSDEQDPFRPVRPISGNFLRVERQTLRRLPTTGAIIFTIRIYADPVAMLAEHRECRSIVAALLRQLDGFTAEEHAYKGMKQADIDSLCEHLREVLD